MGSDDAVLAVRIVAGLAGLWWAILVLIRRVRAEIARRREGLNDGAAIISTGRIIRAVLALLLVGTLLVTSIILAFSPKLYGAITPYVGLFYLALAVGWSGNEERTEQLLDRHMDQSRTNRANRQGEP